MRGRVARGAFAFALALAGWGCGEGEGPDRAGGAATTGGGATATAGRGVMFVGFDGSPPLVKALERGQLQGLVLQNPYRMGQLAVKTLVDHLEGKKVERTIATGETIATPENMTSPEVDALLHPPKAEHSTNAVLTGAKRKKWRVMVIPKGTTHEFWKTIHAGALKGAEDHGDVEIVWQGPLEEDDRTDQIKLVQNAVAAKVDGICLAPLDAKALVAPVEQAIEAGIPVVIFDSALKSDKPVSYVATDNYHGGVLAAERLAELLKGGGPVILVRYMVGSASTEEREQGFVDTLKKHPKIRILTDKEYAGATADSAQKTAQTIVTRYRGQFAGIFTPNESSTSGMLRAMKDAGMLAGR
jgi:ribose transport system substrate-binding protein